jgi:bacterioferritin-associated ferredoxin
VYVCLCRAVTDRDVLRAVDEGAHTLRLVARRSGAGTACGGCRPAIAALIRARLGRGADEADVIPLDPAREGES